MTRSEILKRVNDIFRDILENESILLTDDTTADDVEEWDSLTHVQLVVSIEKAFSIRFSSHEILSWKNIGEMMDAIEKKI
mgnify:CR=1 FL=1